MKLAYILFAAGLTTFGIGMVIGTQTPINGFAAIIVSGFLIGIAVPHIGQ